jgi:hypothetical protein
MEAHDRLLQPLRPELDSSEEAFQDSPRQRGLRGNIDSDSIADIEEDSSRQKSASPTLWSLDAGRRKIVVFTKTVKKAIKDMTPHQLALCLGIGIAGGLWPVPGTTWIACGVLQAMFCILPALVVVIQAVNILLAPVQLLCIPVFVHEGETLLGSPTHLDLRDFKLSSARDSFYFGIVAWLVFCPFCIVTVYGFTRMISANLHTNSHRRAAVAVSVSITSAIGYALFHPAFQLEILALAIIAVCCCLLLYVTCNWARSQKRYAHLRPEIEQLKESI